MKNWGIFLFLISVLLIPFSVFAFSYSRTPAGYTIQNPITFSENIGSYEEFRDSFCSAEEWGYWGIFVCQNIGGDEEGYCFDTELMASSTLSHDFIETLPLHEYHSVKTICRYESGVVIAKSKIEGNGIDILFEVVGAEAEANFIPISGTFVAEAVAYIDDLAVGLLPLMALFIGVPLAFWFIDRFISLGKIK